MPYRALADFMVVIHLAFVVFVIFGGLLALRWPRIVWLHLPAATWGAAVEFSGWICPLTPLEVWLRLHAGESAYRGEFIEQYILPLLYLNGLTRSVQFMLGALVLAVNVLIYGLLWHRRFKTFTYDERD